MALLRKVEGQRALLVVSGPLQVTDDVAEKRKRSKDANFLSGN